MLLNLHLSTDLVDVWILKPRCDSVQQTMFRQVLVHIQANAELLQTRPPPVLMCYFALLCQTLDGSRESLVFAGADQMTVLSL